MANINKDKKYHFIYKTTNLLNGKYYVGMHSTVNLKDGYLGSGKRLRYSIRKYGESNFKCEILEFFSSREKLVEREKELVNEALLQDPMCMNLKVGGNGGGIFLPEYQKLGASAGAKAHNDRAKVDSDFRRSRAEKMKTTMRRLFKEGVLKGQKNFLGRKHTEESRELMRKSHRNKHQGVNNSQYGTIWITDGIEEIKINKRDNIPEGWKKGRKKLS